MNTKITPTILMQPTSQFRYIEAMEGERSPFAIMPRKHPELDDEYYVLQQKWISTISVIDNQIKHSDLQWVEKIEWRDIEIHI